MAAIQGLLAFKEPCEIEITTDAEYVRQGITQWIGRWKRRQDADQFLARRQAGIEFFCILPTPLLERTVHFFRGAAESVASLGLPVPLPVSASHARLNSPGVSNSREALNLLAFPASHARARPGAKIACSAV
jgi:hypothetical protein